MKGKAKHRIWFCVGVVLLGVCCKSATQTHKKAPAPPWVPDDSRMEDTTQESPGPTSSTDGNLEDFGSIRLVAEPVDLLKIQAFVATISKRYDELKSKGAKLGAMDCRPISNANVRDSFLCFSKTMADQNATFTRASTYSEGSEKCPSDNVVPFDHAAYTDYVERIWGHDIMSDKLIPFFTQAQEEGKYAQHETCGMNAYEKAFNKNVLENMKKKMGAKPFAVITAFADLPSEYELKETVSHEAIHAQYFLNKPVRDAVNAYWKDHFTQTERDEVLRELGDFYDASNTYVVLNELLAYMAAYGEPRNIGSVGAHKEDFIRFVESESGVSLFKYPK